MVSSGRQAIACILLILGVAIYSQAQTTPAKEATVSISGKVTLKGKGVPGIIVVAHNYNYRGLGDRARYRATTDASGNYRISNVPEGSYQIFPHASGFALENELVHNPLNIVDGETVEDLNFVLLRGGVITGRLTDSDGQPLIEQAISVIPMDQQSMMSRTLGHILTDDRGIYRAFGLRAGKYKVAAGSQERRLPVAGRSTQFEGLTFHPSTTDESKATVIELAEGGEVKDVDIVMIVRGPAGFKVSGRIIDGETGKPFPNVTYGVTHHYDGGTSSTSGPRSNADGEFRFENLLPGKYSVYVQPEPNKEFRANPVRFEVTDSDITGLVIKTVKAASLSGVVVIEGADEKSVSKKLSELQVSAYMSLPVPTTDVQEMHDMHNVFGMLVKPDGSFRITGLRGGIANISVSSIGRSNTQDTEVVRVERDGIVQTSGINVKDGEHVQGLRLVVRQLTGAIRGQVKIEGGEIPRYSHVFIAIALIDGTTTRSYRQEQVDSRGRFYVQGLAAGRYEVSINALGQGLRVNPNDTKQEVTVVDNTVSEVVLTVKLKPDNDDDDDNP